MKTKFSVAFSIPISTDRNVQTVYRAIIFLKLDIYTCSITTKPMTKVRSTAFTLRDFSAPEVKNFFSIFFKKNFSLKKFFLDKKSIFFQKKLFLLFQIIVKKNSFFTIVQVKLFIQVL